MRQGQVLSNGGRWIGSQHGGVKAPAALLPPDPTTKFIRIADRLDALSAGHPMADWLGFMARLARAQHAVSGMMGPIAGPVRIAAEEVVEILPPIAAHRHRRDPIWRDGLAMLLEDPDVRRPWPMISSSVPSSLPISVLLSMWRRRCRSTSPASKLLYRLRRCVCSCDAACVRAATTAPPTRRCSIRRKIWASIPLPMILRPSVSMSWPVSNVGHAMRRILFCGQASSKAAV